MSSKTSAKAHLRLEIRRTLKELSTAQIGEFSTRLRHQLLFPTGAKVAIFAGTSTEPMLLNLIKESPGTNWFLPKVTGADEMDFIQVTLPESLKKGPFGILEPVEGAKTESLDYIVCPGLAFTMEGKRLGQGGGFYDRALLRFPKATILGVAFPIQIFDDLPSEEHDREMDHVLTPDSASSNETPEY